MLLLYVHIEDYMLFLKHPELYPIGEGEFGWICQSFENYILGCQVAIGWDIIDRKSTRLNSSHNVISRMPSSA